MKIFFGLLTAGICAALPALASVYSCKSNKFCECLDARGCSGLDQYLHDAPTEVCREEGQVFEATTSRGKVVLNGEKLKITFREARPYFNDFDWYQASATEDHWLINLHFDNESPQTIFQINQMAQNSVNKHVWTLTGTCEAAE